MIIYIIFIIICRQSHNTELITSIQDSDKETVCILISNNNCLLILCSIIT